MRFLRMLTHKKCWSTNEEVEIDKNKSSNDVACVQSHVVASVNYLKNFPINLTFKDHNVSFGPNER